MFIFYPYMVKTLNIFCVLHRGICICIYIFQSILFQTFNNNYMSFEILSTFIQSGNIYIYLYFFIGIQQNSFVIGGD